LIDFGKLAVVDFAGLLEEMIALVAEDAEALGCVAEIEGLRGLIATGTSADRQRAVYHDAVEAGDDSGAAMRAVVQSLIEEYHADL